ncbi:MAG: 5'/3'-nucleotidase SurE [Spirochaetales bacterium]|nr:5'/3'-nucleotidase SurE [Spirochaetales bacterium]
MKILITNDDGVLSPVFPILLSRLANHEVCVVAPDRERSGCSHSISLNKPIKFKHLDENYYSCSGTPADCVMYSLLGAIPFKPDFVISGINLGPNLGTDLVYSGTAAAARQATLMGIPAASFSLNKFQPPFALEEASSFIAENIYDLYNNSAKDYFFNVNFPETISEKTEIEYVNLGRRAYNDSLAHHAICKKEKFYFLSGTLDHMAIEDDSDWAAVERGNIAVSQIFVHPVGLKNFKKNQQLNLINPTKLVD